MRPESSLALLRREHDRIDRDIHVGVLVPWVNTVVETELPRLGLERVIFHYARLVPASATTALDEAFLSGLLAAVPDALSQLERLPLAAVLVACTSAGFAVREVHPVGVATAFEALAATLTRRGVERIALATPYPSAVTDREVEAFARRGIAVTASASLDLDDGYAMVTAGDIRSLLDLVDLATLTQADALVLSCTGWPTLSLVPELEATLGLPVFSSNLAVAMHAIHVAHAREYA